MIIIHAHFCFAVALREMELMRISIYFKSSDGKICERFDERARAESESREQE